MKLPFRLMPGSWGLRGKTYEKAKLEYEYSGEELERKLIDFEIEDELERKKRHLDLDKQHGKISIYDYSKNLIMLTIHDPILQETQLLELDISYQKIDYYEGQKRKIALKYPKDSKEYKIEMTKLDFESNKITQQEYDKTIATINDNPYITIKNTSYNKEDGISGLYFEFDWNSKFIELLKENGYVGLNDDTIVQDWFNDICRTTLMEQAMEEDVEDLNVIDLPTIKKNKINNKTEYY